MKALQVFFNARELAKINRKRGFTCFPKSTSGWQAFAKREGWDKLPANVARKRSGRDGGGGMEYHTSILPELIHGAIFLAERQASELAAQNARREDDKNKMVLRSTLSLNARQRMAMEARSTVLLAIDRYQMERGMTRSKAINAFVQAQKHFIHRENAEAARDAGAALSQAEMTLLQAAPALVSDAGFGLTPELLLLANDRPRGVAKISRSTVYNWYKGRVEGGIGGLAPTPTMVDQPLPKGFSDFLTFYAKPQKPSIAAALKKYMETVTDPAMALSLNQVEYTLRTKLNNIEKNVGREGLLTIRSRLAYVQRTTDNLLPTTIYTADGKTFDAEIADWKTSRPVKPEITSILDVATRRCVGIAISRKENAVAVTEALRNACVEYGIPAVFYTDRGAGYKNKIMDGDINGLMGRLSITKYHALPRNSQAKGIIERFNRTAWNPLAQTLPTYLGKDMDKEASEKAHKKTRADLKEFGFSRLLPTWDEFREMCNQTVVDYNSTPHSGLPKFEDPETGRIRHMSPNDAWAAHVADGFEPVPVEADIQDDLFRPYVERVARRGLVEWNTNSFFHNDLEAYHGKKVLVGYDDNNARFVWVREIDRAAGQPGRLICVADYYGNKVDYIPRTAQKAAEDKRTKGRLRLAEKKIRDIKEEQNTPFQLDHTPMQPAPFLAADSGRQVEPVNAPRNDVSPPLQARRAAKSIELLPRPEFAVAEQVIADPSSISPGQQRVLHEMLKRRAGSQILKGQGFDLVTLSSALRAARAFHNASAGAVNEA